MDHSPFLFVRRFSPAQEVPKEDITAIDALLQSDEAGWAHLDATNALAREWLSDHLTYLDPLVVNSLLADETRPRCDDMGNGLLMILRAVNLNEGADPEDMLSIRLWVDPNRVISLERRNVKAIRDVAAEILESKGGFDSAMFVGRLCVTLLERMEPLFTALEDQVDALEEEVIGNPERKIRTQISELRRRILILRRYIAPQRDALGYLYNSRMEWLDDTDRRHIRECQDRFTRLLEQLDVLRERLQIVQDELMNTLSDQLNSNMYLLSIIAAIFLPLGFLTGLLGINVGGIPGVEDNSAFAIVCGLLGLITGLQLIFFKWKKWI